jgi:ketosteroid isomerase-like protein
MSTRFLVAAIAVLLAGGCTPYVVNTGGAEPQELEERQASFFAALAARDVAATAAHFSDDAVLQVAGMPAVRGRDAIRGFYGSVFRFLSESTARPEALRVSAGGDVGYGLGSVVNVFAGEEGPLEFGGKYLLVWERRQGSWVITAYSVSSDQPERG